MAEPAQEIPFEETASSTSRMATVAKSLVACAFLYSAATTFSNGNTTVEEPRRQLSMVGDSTPTYMEPLLKDLRERKKLFDETPPEEVKYWFEYTGPLQKYFYRFSKSRGKSDYFEGRDDSGVTSYRFMEELMGTEDHAQFFGDTKLTSDEEKKAQIRLLENCLAMGSPTRPDTNSALWKEWFGGSSAKTANADRCRVLFTINTVGAGRGTTMLWETNPPKKYAQGPDHWISEQETAATHLQRNLEEINAMCASGQIAARVQILVCEPISAKWTEWMDSLMPNCGGQLSDLEKVAAGTTKVEERPSPVQVVVVSTTNTADTCHDLKSGFMEKRMQDLIIAPPFLGDSKKKVANPAVKTTHPDLVSSDDHDLYVALKWSSMITIRAVHSFLQASADLAAAASSPANKDAPKAEVNADGVSVAISNAPSSPFLVPSFVRVSYVSEENAKVAKWRMHGDFFHPAAWEVCKDSYEMTWIEHSLSGSGGVNGLCFEDGATEMERRLKGVGGDCGQWWIYMAELQMPTSPEVYANEVTPPVVQGGSNFVWMVTERQRREIVKRKVCLHESGEDNTDKCPSPPQAVMPLGDLEGFLINFSPNTALGKKHVKGRRPGYSREKEREEEREKVRERKQLKGQEDIEKALFDYTIYPVALFRKDATIKAARARDAILTSRSKENAVGPQTIKSSYYDITITKPRPPVLGWCQNIARKGLCTLYADYFRTSNDLRCMEACGMKKDWAQADEEAQ
mmetsp:Transcript_81442/g.122362  ORF Transcript_81442/g.122362 Transcript_81442/m.122362 type:complete len:742 (-) Transcript_81442:95-2320(-)|eukprot:CAMPEP_0117057024 /NCGR_PEP_ID=MMETSP0472-20121206/39574_1 /TAXON_ID=693140 ORGANISM="Tiarina fusus, Strain LIS" /NCGR_SAMPLE_ID=MMETSP0472 /ASSEMBLY_ACC=CAM_ASM_000603 /LENGTH=741 /DNA_ID=CAMNT_0004773719 /DNA_START=199 /DNA_END=2424 /DNA_ORIENTATION=+